MNKPPIDDDGLEPLPDLRFPEPPPKPPPSADQWPAGDGDGDGDGDAADESAASSAEDRRTGDRRTGDRRAGDRRQENRRVSERRTQERRQPYAAPQIGETDDDLPRRPLSLRIKLFLAVVPVLVAVLALVSWALGTLDARQSRAALIERLEMFTTTNAAVLAQPLWTFDDALVRRFITVMAAHPDLKTLELLDAKGQMLVQDGPVERLGNPPDLTRETPIIYAEHGRETRVGTLRVAFSDHRLIETQRTQQRTYVVSALLAALVVTTVIVLALHRLIFTPLTLLRTTMQKDTGRGVAQRVPWASGDELGQVIRTYNTMEERRADLENTRDRLIELGILMGSERSPNRLIETILQASKEFYRADGGTVYVLDTEQRCLRFGVIINDSLGIRLGGASGDEIPFPPLPMYDAKGEPNHHFIATHAALTGHIINIPNAYNSDEFDFTGPRRFDAQNNYRSTSFLVVPLKNRQGQVTGVLQLINATNPKTGAVVPFDRAKESVVEALGVQAGVALENQLLLQAQKALLDSFIELLASAIDAKSPYTGGHCARVPVITRLLTEAACAETTGPFAGFSLTEDEWYELHIASWLHDCGKVTSPEYVVDKATKLETIHNRIHEVRARFEILWRDAEIRCLQGLLDGGDPITLTADRTQAWERLQDDFAFVAQANIGGEFMKDEDIARLHAIAQTPWLRHFDDRLGLSQDEMTRLAGIPPQPLPTWETLLADKPEHIFRWPDDTPPLDKDNRYGIAMLPPAVQYNRGELYNLCIRRGTLTDEERYKINDHIVQTIIMLESLPFPSYLKRVPEYAGGHHERMDGTGYPRRIRAGEMSIPARIMAIADVFEALTASDRPYKAPKTVSQALRIMSFMRNEGHIDPALFDLFLHSGVWRTYAEQHLAPNQLDAVDITAFLSSPPDGKAPPPARA